MICINRNIKSKDKDLTTKPAVKMLVFSALLCLVIFVSSLVELRASLINGGFEDFQTDIFFCKNSRKEQIFKQKDMQNLYVLKILTLIIPVPGDLPDEKLPKEEGIAVYANDMLSYSLLLDRQNTEKMEANSIFIVCCGFPHMPPSPMKLRHL